MGSISQYNYILKPHPQSLESSSSNPLVHKWELEGQRRELLAPNHSWSEQSRDNSRLPLHPPAV